MYDEFISHVVAELEDRFTDNPASRTSIGLLYLLPSECSKLSNDTVVPTELAEAVEMYDRHAESFNVLDRVYRLG